MLHIECYYIKFIGSVLKQIHLLTYSNSSNGAAENFQGCCHVLDVCLIVNRYISL